MKQVIATWAHPRSLSTAFERMMLERGDFVVLHEPFSFHYYHSEQGTTGPHYGADMTYPKEYPAITEYIQSIANNYEVYFKDISYHGFENVISDDQFLKSLTNTFIIRDPAQAIASHFAMNPDVAVGEIGYWHQHRLFRKICDLTGNIPPVIDADDLVADPRGVVASFCQAVGIPFLEQSLIWQPANHNGWNVWKTWHEDVAASTGFKPVRKDHSRTIHNDPVLKSYYDYHLPYYLEMHHWRLQPETNTIL